MSLHERVNNMSATVVCCKRVCTNICVDVQCHAFEVNVHTGDCLVYMSAAVVAIDCKRVCTNICVDVQASR